MFCLICNQNIYNFRRHFRSRHNLTAQEYYDKYLKRNRESVCKCGCGGLTSWIEYLNKYGDFVNRSHQMSYFNKLDPTQAKRASRLAFLKNPDLKNILKRYLKEHPEHQSKVGRLGIKKALELHPEMPQLSRERLSKFQKDRVVKGGTRVELLVYNHPFIKAHLDSGKMVKQDTRFRRCIGNRAGVGGIILDLSIPDLKICIELDGVWGHDPIKDHQRDNKLFETHGWKTIRFSYAEIESDLEDVISRIKLEMRPLL